MPYDLRYQVSGFVMKIEQHFPLMQGEIVRISGTDAVIRLGQARSVSPGTRFVALQTEGRRDIRSGRVRQFEDRFVQLAVRRPGRGSILADIVPADAKHVLQEGDFAYAR
jgi:hypothetical protein